MRMNKKVISSDLLRNIATSAIGLIATPVKRTLGPRGNPIIIQMEGKNPDGSDRDPVITKDGVTVAENTKFRDPALNTIAQTIIQVAKKTVDQGGDGTTTSVVLAEAIYKEGLKHIERGSNSIDLYKNLQKIKDEALAYIDSIKKPVVTDEQLRNVAMISSNGDEEISDLVVEAIKAAGEHGYIELEDGRSKDSELQVIEGAFYKSGWRKFGPNGSLLVNDKSRNVCEFEESAILLYAGKMDSVHDLSDFINRFMKFDERLGHLTEVNPLVIVAYDYSDEVRDFILQQRHQAKLPIAAIKAPRDGSPNHATEMLHDMAALMGATVTARGLIPLESATDEHLGYAKKVTIGQEETVFYEGGGSKEDIKSRLEELETLLNQGALDPWDAQNVRLRKGKLSNGIVIMRVGGVTDAEIKEKKDRAEDALCAAKVARQDGIVAGGGVALYNFGKTLTGEDSASRIMSQALQAPIRQIIENSGKSPDIILTTLSQQQNANGYDVRGENFVIVEEQGIVDPAIVTKSALQNAVSIAGLLLTTGGALVSDMESQDGQANPLAAMMGMQ